MQRGPTPGERVAHLHRAAEGEVVRTTHADAAVLDHRKEAR